MRFCFYGNSNYFKIEYCSTDAHSGCKPSFRGDLEILLWNLAHWASGDLPWLTLIKEGMPDSQKEKVASLKREMLANSDQFMSDLGIGKIKIVYICPF